MSYRYLRLIGCMLLVGVCLGGGAFGADGAADAVKDSALTLELVLKKAQGLPEYEPVWEVGTDIFRLASDTNIAQIEKVAQSEHASSALACGYALLKLGRQEAGAEALLALVARENVSLGRKREAIAALGVDGGGYAADQLHSILMEKKAEEILLVEYAKALWRLNRSVLAKDTLTRMLSSESTAVREEAAIVLATFAPYADLEKLIGTLVFRPGSLGDRARQTLERRAQEALRDGKFSLVQPILRTMAEHPTLDLGTAMTLMEVRGAISNKTGLDRNTYQFKTGTSDTFITNLLTELVGMTREYYPLDKTGTPEEIERNKKRLTSTDLAEAAAKAYVSAIDPFCAYLDEEDIGSMKTAIEGEYGGIGAWVGMRDRRFTIITPMYGAPAAKAGLQSMDWIESIDGTPIKNMTQNEIINMLKGPPNTVVKLLVWRKGWQQGREYGVVRELIHIDSVKGRMLPGNIGYVRLISFSRDTAGELEKMLRSLEKEGMKALILDLSDNPGGLLESAGEVASKFLGADKLIVYSEGLPTYYRRTERRTTMDSTHPTLPMVVMVNSGSASASEIVSGALQDLKRARLVGETTYGKGSVQQLFPVRATGGRTQVKMTVAYYYLPSGRCIHGKGIEPDVKEEAPMISFEQIDARLKLRDTQKPMEYVRAHIEKSEKLFLQLLDDDFEDPMRYPDFEAFRADAATTGIKIDDQDLRRELRFAIQRYFESEEGRDVIVDVMENVPLQRAIIELGKEMPSGLPQVRAYESFQKKFNEREEQRKKLEVAKGEFHDGDAASETSESMDAVTK